MKNNRYFLLVFANILTLLWWQQPWFNPSPLNTDPILVQRILAVMGLFYLLLGSCCFFRHPNPWTRLFFIYSCCTAIHWAGPIGGGENFVGKFFLSFYVLIGSSLFGSILLHLAISYPSLRLRKSQLVLIYLPALLTILAILTAALSSYTLDLVLLTFSLGSFYGIAGGMLWLLRLLTRRNIAMSKRRSLIAVAALLIAWVPGALAGNDLLPLGEFSGLANLSLVFHALVLTWMGANSGSHTDKLY